jgi:prepilin-type N-terminal cleavage/methylation domain-containing protein
VKRLASSRHGFTLLEILIALSIFVGAVAVLSRLVTLGLDSADFARLQAEGTLLIENRFAELDAAILEVSAASGSADEGFPGWTYDLEIENAGNFLYRVTGTAKHQSGIRVSLARLYFDEIEAEEKLSQNSSSGASSGSSSTSSSSSSGGGS